MAMLPCPKEIKREIRNGTAQRPAKATTLRDHDEIDIPNSLFFFPRNILRKSNRIAKANALREPLATQK